MFSNYKNACKTHCVKQTLPSQKKIKKMVYIRTSLILIGLPTLISNYWTVTLNNKNSNLTIFFKR